MKHTTTAVAGIGLALALAASAGAWGEAAQIRVARQSGLGQLPLVVMQHDKLIEKHLYAMGLESVKVEWVVLDASADPNAALGGKADLVGGSLGAFLAQWGRTHGGVKAAGTLAEYPLLLNSSNPDVKTIADFSAKDKIAVSRAGSASAFTLQAAAAQKWGAGEFGKLDPLTVNMSGPEAAQALLAGKDGVNAHVAGPRVAAIELKDGKVHTVLSSYDVWGPHTGNVVWANSGFADANPKLYEAFTAALAEAFHKINDDKDAVAKTYVEATQDKDGAEAVAAVLSNPDVHYTQTPHAVMKQAQFQRDAKVVDSVPASWKDLFFPNAWKFRGS